jgi:TonB family protein
MIHALILSHAIAAAGEPAYLASCPAEAGRIVQPAVWIAPDDVHATNRRARFFVDLGSDGRVRRVALVESSGDARFDGKAQAALEQEKFAPGSQNCISTSSVTPQSFDVPLISLVTPPPAGATGAVAAIPTAQPASAVTICPAPFVQLTGIDVPMTRQKPATVAIDVSLNAAAKVTGVSLAKSSGNQAEDYLATSSARTAQYQFVLPPGCAPKATTYRLEITYR